MKLHQDFKEFLKLLNESDVEYLIIGVENSKRIIAVLREFGVESLKLRESDFQKPDNVIQLGYPPYRIDLLTSIEGLEFEKCYQKKKKFRIDKNLIANVIDIESLKTSKRIAGRKRDLGDLDNLK